MSRAPSPAWWEALDRLAAQGAVLAVCTNKLEYLARLLLDGLGLSPRFAAITGADTYGIAKPDPLPLSPPFPPAAARPPVR